MVTSPRTRVALSAACTAVLALATPTIEASPARAADTITAADQPYFAYYHLDQARAKGYTGKGVTIALIDGPVDVSAPELSGATITDNSPCSVVASAESKSHGTALASLLVAQSYGVAPEVTLLSYVNTDDTSNAGSNCKPADGPPLTSNASLINHAINDGATIITNAKRTTARLSSGRLPEP